MVWNDYGKLLSLYVEYCRVMQVEMPEGEAVKMLGESRALWLLFNGNSKRCPFRKELLPDPCRSPTTNSTAVGPGKLGYTHVLAMVQM